MTRSARALTAVVGLALAGLPAAAHADEDPAVYDWSAVAVQQPPATMHPGQVVALTVVLRNEGTTVWLGEEASSEPVRLAAVSPRDRRSAFAIDDPTWLWSQGRRIRMSSPAVPPGGLADFTFSFRAPELSSYPRSFIEYFAPVVDGVVWMDGRRVALTTTVVPASGSIPAIPSPTSVPSSQPMPEPTPPPLPTPTPVSGYAWEPVAVQQPPAAMHPGAKALITIALRNSGTETWRAEETTGTSMRLAAVHAPGVQPRERASAFGREDPTWLWSGGKRIRMATPVVEPGGIATFTFTFTAPVLPAYPQTFVERFAPIVEGVTLLDSAVLTLTTQVRPSAGALPPVPEAPDVPSPSPVPLPTVEPSPLPTIVPTLSPTPTVPPAPGTTCPTSASPTGADADPAVAAGYSASGSLLSGTLAEPSAVAYGLGKLFAADAGNDRIARTDPAGFVVDYFGSTGSGPGQMRRPGGVAISDSGLVFVADTGNDRIQVYGFAGVYVAQFGTTGSDPGQFRGPRGISVIPNGPLAGNLAIADTGNDRVQIVSRTGSPIAVFGGPGEGPGEFSSPAAVSVWRDTVFVADTGNERVQRLTLDGRFAGAWGGPGSEAGCTSAPAGILASASGVFVSESGSGRVERFTRWGVHIETFGSLAAPAGIALDPSARLYVAEGGGNRVARFTPAAAAAPATP